MSRAWSKEDVEKLMMMRGAGKTFREISLTMPDRTPTACRLKHSNPGSSHLMWTPQMTNQLLILLRTKTKKEISKIMGIPVPKISDKMHRMGIKFGNRRITSAWVVENTGVSRGTVMMQKAQLGYPSSEPMTIERAITLIVHLKQRNVMTSILRLNSAIRTLQQMQS